MKDIKWWKIVLFCFCFIFAFLLLEIISTIIEGFIPMHTIRVIYREIYIRMPLTILLFWILSHYWIRKPQSFFMIKKPTKAIVKWIIVGVILPTLVVMFYFIARKINIVSVTVPIPPSIIVYYITETIVYAIGAGVIEEFLYRGYIFRLLEEKWNSLVAVLIPSFLFGIIHILNIGVADKTSLFLVVVGGTSVSIMLAMIVYKTRNIWNAVVVHIIWNLVLSGRIISLSCFEHQNYEAIFPFKIVSNNAFLTGGRFGAEAALPAVIVFVVFTIILLFYRKNK